ncbi:hypothetical protein A1O7_04663 [Cladophialophora yegresii CBS 114405]|uniref:Telomeric single stranded DNA binding POT1/Cdc13 domain-containing protein n=1 Tax=Cladophialophora yegresii CBS 114405 TaxID=1182544 RepID=W9W690_9EURO|nr:uncharacterized protein A1O7_04663 [Cladophialophora yegresii CBS 114405]EXJ60510.1 hypothetical protein A1O7_04663 [Cladophialophora yegresii CBS 114405]
MTTVALTFETLKQIPIADLAPASDHASSSSYILAQVVLVWPYSSSTGTLALLLADTDVRRRKSKGQVKVVFRHGCAREVARTKVGIGDTVKLVLDGCKWTETGGLVSTPGKKIDWDLEYWKQVILQVHRDGDLHSTVDYRANESDTSSADSPIALVNGAYNTRPSVNGVLHRQPSTIHVPYLTPQKPGRRVSAGTFIDAALHSLVEDDGYVPGQGRKRTKFARKSGAWSLVDSDEESEDISQSQVNAGHVEQQQGLTHEEINPTAEPSDHTEQDHMPTEETNLTVETSEHTEQHPMASEDIEHERTENLPANILQTPDVDVVESASGPPRSNSEESTSIPQPVVMGPPSTPHKATQLHLPPGEIDVSQISSEHDAATTPRLLPLASPGLPLVSPLVQRSGVEVGYFSVFHGAASQLEASGDTPAAVATEEARPESELNAASLPGSEGSLMIVEEVSVLQKRSADIEAEPVGRLEHTKTLDGVVIETGNAVGTSSAGYQVPQWLSVLESKIDEERLRSHDEASSEIAPQLPDPRKAVEDEDDDMYGAPADMSQTNGFVISPSSFEPPKSPLDVLEQFLQMSPVAPTRPSNAFEQIDVGNVSNIPITPLHESMEESAAADGRQEKTSIPASEKPRSVAYPESQSPFRQNRAQQTGSGTSSRRSSDYRTRLRSLDGTLEPNEPFADYINQLAQIAATAGSVQPPAGDAAAAYGASQRDADPGLDVPPAGLSAQELGSVESSGGAAEVTPQAYEIANIDTSEGTDPHSATQTVKLDDREEHIINQSVSLRSPEAQVQLPTRDQSQLYPPSPERNTRLEQTEDVKEVTVIALPTPQQTQEEAAEEEVIEQAATQDNYEEAAQDPREISSTQQEEVSAQVIAELEAQTQEEISTDSFQEAPAQDARGKTPVIFEDQEKEEPGEALSASATPAMAPTTPYLHPDSVVPRRASQRLSARKSTMASNISSPYFTPRKPAPAPSSSPNRKENLHPASPDRSELRSSPVQESRKTPVAFTLFQETKPNGIDITPISPNLQAKRPTSHRHIGITTPLAYYAHLSSLHEQFGQILDIIAVCTEPSASPQRSKSGPKDYYTTLRLADPSLLPDQHTAVSAQIFRHAINAVPITTSGDVVILRNFKVQTSMRNFMLLSTETSSWAVFQAKPGSTMSWSDVIVSGPPIEYGPAETSRVKLLFSWWNSGSKQLFSPSTSTNDHELTGVDSSEPRSSSPRRENDGQPPVRDQHVSDRRTANMTSEFGNEDAVENFYASFANGDDGGVREDTADGETAHAVLETRADGDEMKMIDDTVEEAEINVRPAQRTSRRKANRTDHMGNEDDEDVSMIGQDREKSAPLIDATNQRRRSTVSIAASEPGRSLTPRRSTRQKHRKSPSLVHELRDGTKYVDDDRRKSGSVVHELRDGVTYVD